MIHPRGRLILITALVAIVALIVGWYGYTEYRKAQFLSDLHLVDFSTSLIRSPSAEQERAAHQRAETLGIDLFAAYENNLEHPGSATFIRRSYTIFNLASARFDLAWMLITNESTEYYQWVKQNIDTVPWPEVRIWRDRHSDDSLSSEYREKLLDVLLQSPTSEAKLFVGRWYLEQGKLAESEDAYHSAMTEGLFWDALDAADQLVESERYHLDAVTHLLTVVRDTDWFIWRASISLLDVYEVREELGPLVESCRKEPKDGPHRQELIAKLTRLVENDRQRDMATSGHSP